MRRLLTETGPAASTKTHSLALLEIADGATLRQDESHMAASRDPQHVKQVFEARDALGNLIGARFISLDANECVFEYDVKPQHYNPNGILHGGALYTVMDSSQGAFVHFTLEEQYQAAATGTATIKYLQPIRHGTIRIRTWLKEKQGRKIFVSSLATDSKGVEVASLEEIWIAIPR